MKTASVDLPVPPYWRLTPTEDAEYKDWLEASDAIYAILVQEYLEFYRHNEEHRNQAARKLHQHLYENQERQHLLKLVADEIAMQPITLKLSISNIKNIPEGMLHIENIIQSGHGTIELREDPEHNTTEINFTHESIKKPFD